MIRVLVACERSGIVRAAFNAYSGVEAFSCDLEPCEDGPTDFHIQGDALEVISRGWDLVIAHPPCRYLVVGYFEIVGAYSHLVGIGVR